MTLNERDRRAIILGGVALGVIALYFLGVDPLQRRYDGMTSRHDTNASAIARILANEQKAKYYTEQVSELEDKVGPLLPPKYYSEQISLVYEKVVSAAKQANIQLKGANPTAPIVWPDDPGLQQASILIDAEGEWENAFKFISAVYRLEGILSVEQMELSSSKNKGGRLALQLKLSVLVKAPEQSEKPWSR